MQSWSPLMWFSLSLSLPLTLGLSHSDGPFIRCGQHFGHREMGDGAGGGVEEGGGAVFICFQFHLNDSSPWSRFLCSLTPIPFSHFFISLSLLFFFFDYKNGPYSRSPGHSQLQLCSKLS